MILIVLGKFRKKPTKEMVVEAREKTDAALAKIGGKRLGSYFTFGRYDYVTIIDRPDNVPLTSALKAAIGVSDEIATETLVALKSEEVTESL